MSYNPNNAARYALRDFRGSDYLAFRDLPQLFTRFDIDGRALDYGCGAGRSTRFLRQCGFDVDGADISAAMIDAARRSDPTGEYHLIHNGSLPFADHTFDLMFSSYMLLEIASKNALKDVMREAQRVLTPAGHVCIITNTPEFYKGRWVSCDVGYSENSGELRSGQNVKVCLLPEKLELTDYFWSDTDYKEVFDAAGLRLVNDYRPLGKPDDPVTWLDESSIAPYVVYLLRNE